MIRREIKTKPKSEAIQRETQPSKMENKIKSVPLIPCGCHECRLTMPAVNKWGRPRRYLRGHQPKARGEKHHKWKGENVGYCALHDWIRSRLSTPSNNECQLCHRTDKRLEVACIGDYSRLGQLETNWKWACRSCNEKDPRTIKKIRERLLGRYLPGETKVKISKSMKGPNHPNFGKRSSEETKVKQSQAHMGRKRKRFSDEHRARMSQAKMGSKNRRRASHRNFKLIKVMFSIASYRIFAKYID